MSISTITKVFTGLAITGGVVSTPFLLNGSTNQQNAAANQLEGVDKGKYYLERNFENCEKLLDDKARQGDYKQIYLCKLGSDKLEFIYYDKEGSKLEEVSKKIKSLDQHMESNYSLKLKVKLEDESVETLDWPNLLFSYTSPKSSERTYLMPGNDCKLTLEGKPTLFECNETWKVIKPKQT